MAAKNILLVDDEPVVAFAVSDYLGQCGFVVTVETQLGAARAAIDRHRYDLLLADLRLAGSESLDGLELAGAALRAGRVDHAVILTAYSTDATVTRAAVLGVAAVLQKPVPLAEIVALIDSLLTPPALENR